MVEYSDVFDEVDEFQKKAKVTNCPKIKQIPLSHYIYWRITLQTVGLRWTRDLIANQLSSTDQF